MKTSLEGVALLLCYGIAAWLANFAISINSIPSAAAFILLKGFGGGMLGIIAARSLRPLTVILILFSCELAVLAFVVAVIGQSLVDALDILRTTLAGVGLVEPLATPLLASIPFLVREQLRGRASTT